MAKIEEYEKLKGAQSLQEVKDLLQGHPELDAERVWSELENHRSNHADRLDLEELESVSGGADRDWLKDGCAATCEYGSWCSSNDYCVVWDVTYENYWTKCPDGHEHVYKDGECVRCGYFPF